MHNSYASKVPSVEKSSNKCIPDLYLVPKVSVVNTPYRTDIGTSRLGIGIILFILRNMLCCSALKIYLRTYYAQEQELYSNYYAMYLYISLHE